MLLVLHLLQLFAGVALAAAGFDDVIVSSNRWLEADAHAHDNLETELKWAGIFRFTPNTIYNLTVKIPPENSDPHAGHNHRRLGGPTNRKLQDDDHSGHDHSSHTETHEDHSEHDHDGDGVPDHPPEDHSGHDHSSHAADYHFLVALVPVTATGQEGIDEAFVILDGMGGSIVNVEDGDSIAASTQHIYELYFHDPESTSSLSIVNITQENYVLFLPDTPGQVSQLSGDYHFLVDDQGVYVWPTTARYYTEPDPYDGPKPWGTVIGATLLVNVVTLIGVVFLVPMLTTAFRNKTMGQAWKDLTSSSDIELIGGRTQILFDMCITSFACGALLATTVFLILPEAMALVNAEDEGEDSHEGHNHRMLQEDDDHAGHDHGNKTWVFGTCLMAGFLFPMFLASFFPHHHLEDHQHTHPHDHHHSTLNITAHETVELKKQNTPTEEEPKNSETAEIVEAQDDLVGNGTDGSNNNEDEEASEEKGEEEGSPKKKKEINKRLVSGILLGDALHNFADGVFVGAAFLLCGDTLGWTVLAGTIYHELAQEVSDFFILTTQCHLPPIQALALNFLSGLSVTLGGIVVLAINVGNYALGIILSMSAGVYINVAAKECMPIVDRLAVTIGDRALAFLFFMIGAVPIGLVLLNHQHCEA